KYGCIHNHFLPLHDAKASPLLPLAFSLSRDHGVSPSTARVQEVHNAATTWQQVGVERGHSLCDVLHLLVLW
ncbi:hypothetical protein CEXT_317071, partial [Caerostris extrusa]